VIEYAVQMTEFPQQALLDGVLRRGELTPDHVAALADRVAAFHAAAPAAPASAPFGEPDLVFQPLRDNFVTLEPRLDDPAEQARLAALRDWSIARFRELHDLIVARKADGRIRECHGDLHLGNLLLLDGVPTPFDCIEFNPGLRWIDVLSDLGFLAMDLVEHGADDYAWRLVNRYLEVTGDYAGMPLLPFYQVYRALVRAKVAALRAAQEGHDNAELHRYLAFAERFTETRRPWLVLMHGLSGSGKSYVSEHLAARLGAVRVRSDVERKRLAGVPLFAPADEARKAALYGAEMNAQTYTRLETLAGYLLDSGVPAIVDAAALHREQRARFAALAARKAVPFAIVATEADAHLLRERLTARAAGEPSDADIAVLERQFAGREPLDEAEVQHAVTAGALGTDELCKALEKLGIK
jgi:hypothetical protein